MLASINKTRSSLRGGGCGTFRMISRTQANLKSDIQDIENFITKFESFVEIICAKANVAINSLESQEIMIAIQWFIFQEENIYKLNKNPQNITKSYNLIVEGIRKLLKSCLIYIRTDQFKCLYILQITASLSKVIFSFHVMNRDRIMKIELQKEFLDISNDLKQSMEIEKNDLIQIQMEFFLFLTKTSFEMTPNNSNEREDIIKGFVNGIFGSLIQMKPNSELLESLFKAICQIHNMYTIKKNRKEFEVYFYLDMLQWEIINYLKYDLQQNLEEIILYIQKTHEKLVKNSSYWKNHFLWIQMIVKILLYNPLITKKKLKQLTSSLNFGAKSMQIWKEYLNKGFLIQMNHSNDQAIILLNQFKNKELTQIDKLILQGTFKEWENLMVLKDYLMNQKNDNIYFTFGSYLKCKLGSMEPQKNVNTQTICKIQQFFDFIISKKLLALIKENDERLGVIVKNQKFFFERNMYFDITIEKATYNSQLKKMVFNYKEYFQNTLKIIKIIRLSQRKQHCEIEEIKQKKINEFILFQQLKYIMRLLEQILLQAIQDIKDNRNEPDESIMLQQEIEHIQKKLQNLNFTDKQSSDVNKFKQKLLALPSATLNKRGFQKEAQCMLKLIQQTESKVSELEVLLIQKESLVKYFQSLLNNLYLYYEHQIQELEKYYNELIDSFKAILILQYEIESVSQPEKLKEIKSQYSQKLSFQCIQKQRLNMLKLKLQLIVFKECFQNTLTIPSEEFQQLKDVINLDDFLLDVTINYPQKLIVYHNQYQKQIIPELITLKVTEEDLQNNLSKYQGTIDYLIFQLSINEQIIQSEKKDLELIQKEFGELFIEQSISTSIIERIKKTIEDISIGESIQNVADEKFNQSQLMIEIEKYENFYNNIERFKQFINQIDKVVIVMRNSLKKNVKLFKIPIVDFLNDLKILQDQIKQNNYDEKEKKEEERNFHKSSSNQQDNQKYEKNQIALKDQQMIEDNLINLSDKKYQTHLQIIINVVKITEKKIAESKQQLTQLLEEVQKFRNDFFLIQDYKKEIQAQMHNFFLKFLQDQVNKFEQSLYTTADLKQIQREDFKEYFERITILLECQDQKDDRNIAEQTNIFDFLNNIKAEIQKILIDSKCVSQEVIISQDKLIKQITNIYLQGDEEEESDEVESIKQFSLLNALNQKYQDFINNDEWKIKQSLVITIIQISSNCFIDTIIVFCQKALIFFWIEEKDQRVRNILKNQHLIKMQMQILSQDWQTQHNRIAGEMQQNLRRVEQLQEQISREANLSKRDIQLKEMDETISQLDKYIQNICEMSQQLNLRTDFVNHIRKGLIRVEGKINEMNKQLNSLGNDIKFLRGKSVQELFEIRKSKVLTEAAKKNVRSIYVPLQTMEIFQRGEKNEQKSILMNLKNLYDKKGQVNEFLLDDKETVLLIHGVAGSGKSTAAKKIEEFIWELHNINEKISNKILIPIYISLPSLKNPVFQAVEEALHQDEYGFDELQLKECKEMLVNKQFRLLLIMDSYDEMKLENIQKNLYINNKLNQNWSDPLVIFTTRSDIFTSSNYADWFAPEEKQKFKEIQLLQFEQSQKQEYLKKFTIQSIKMLIFDIHEWQFSTQNQKAMDFKRFEQSWEKIQSQFFQFDEARWKSETLMDEQQINSIVQFLKDDELIALKSIEASRSLSINLQKQWSFKKYEEMMRSIDRNKLVETPYMMEIIVQVLPNMILKATEIINIKQTFLKNFSNMLEEFYISKYRIQMFKSQQKRHFYESINEVNKVSETQIQVDYDEFLEVTHNDLQNLEMIDYHLIASEVWNILEESLIPQQLQISQESVEVHNQLQRKLENNLLLLKNIKIQQEEIIQFAYDALKEYNLTIYDCYCEFINYYHLKQIEKRRNLGKSIDTDRFMHDLLEYSIRFAKIMSNNQLTQVQYKQQGFLYQNARTEEQWLNEFFNYDDYNGAYKKDIRSCSLVQQKGANYQFTHKSIQEFLVAADLYEVLVQSKNIDTQILNIIIEILSKEQNQNQDCIKFLQNLQYKYAQNYHYIGNSTFLEKQKQLYDFDQTIMQIICLIKIIIMHDFNSINYSAEIYTGTRQYLISKIQRLGQQNY
ncbi:unnamed protein product [Paramecium primaurelia]|uniref:NACHT domain-containing protein n=1 Tax=Paramecium primaurelia TaxID=5886 RepID=A0A8S1PR24_PARPR|nr:unnamed protein product [Paramecium primaurelia]